MNTYPENKSEHIKQFEGFKAILVRHEPPMDYYCGYVRFPQRPVIEIGYKGLLTYIPVHGGITYAKQDEHGMVYGFDCAHLDGELNPNLKDVDWLFAECERMANYIIKAAEFENRYLLSKSNEEKIQVLDEYFLAIGVNHNTSNNSGALIKILSGEL